MSSRGFNHSSKKGKIHKNGEIEVQSFEGLMPDPAVLAEYEKYAPGATKQWMQLATDEVKNRHKNERTFLTTYRFSVICGSLSALILGVVVAGVGMYAIHIGHPTAGATIMCGSMAQVVAAMYYRNKSRSNNKEIEE